MLLEQSTAEVEGSKVSVLQVRMATGRGHGGGEGLGLEEMKDVNELAK